MDPRRCTAAATSRGSGTTSYLLHFAGLCVRVCVRACALGRTRVCDS